MQEGAIVRNKQTGQMGRIVNGQVVPLDGAPQQAPAPQAPQFPGVIQGRPKEPDQPDPFKVQTDQRDFQTSRQDKLFDQTTKLADKFGGLQVVKDYPTVARQYAFALDTSPTPSGDQALIVSYAKMLDPGSVVREAEFDTTAAADSAIGRTVSRLKRELGMEGGGRLSEAARQKVREEMRTLAQQYDRQYQQQREAYAKQADAFGLDPEFVVGPDLSETFRSDIERFWQDQKQQQAGQDNRQSGYGGGGITLDGGTDPGVDGLGDDGTGRPLVVRTDQGLQVLLAERAKDGARVYGIADQFPDLAAVADPQALKLYESIAQRDQSGSPGFFDVAKQGMTLGLSDEAAGIGEAIGSALTGDFNVTGSYQRGKATEMDRINRARESMGPVGSTATEMLAGGAGVIGRAGSVMRAGRAAAARNGGNVTRQGVQRELTRAATREGAMVGAVGGAGYGEGVEGKAVNALGGAALGGVIGRVGQQAGNALANRASNVAFNPARAAEVARAGQAEGVTVNRAMIDPRVQNQFSASEAGSAGPRINQAMNEIGGQIESRVGALGGGRQPLDRTALGDRVQRAGERIIPQTRDVTSRKYQAAERMAGDAKVGPQSARAATATMIRDLSETANTNSAEIGFLQGLLDDFSKPLSIRALRELRTTLRKKISKGDLVFGQNEARVLQIMDEAAQDISQGLRAQGKEQAAAAFDAADSAYAARMDLINGTIQKLIGRRGSNMSAEQVAAKFESMAKNDAEGLRKFWMQLEPDERGDIQATFAEALGRNNKGEFSPAIFLNNIGGANRKMSERAVRLVFGKEGAQSVRNLKTLAEEVNRLDSMRNRSNTARSSNYNEWLTNMLLGGGPAGIGGMMAGGAAGGGLGAVAGAAGAAGVRSVRNTMTANMLLNTRIQKWFLSAPKTANPRAIDAHFAKLGDIAKAEPALAGDIDALRRGIMAAANDNASGGASLAAEDQNPQENR